MILDYPTLRLIWWLLLGILLGGFAVMDGFDFGAAILLPWVGRTERERLTVINAVAPVWEGNQVWFILGAGAIFAAWPMVYSVAFSAFYLAMLLLLLNLILRPVSFKYRNKLPEARWRIIWDRILCWAGGIFPAFLLGVAVGNVLQGVPFYFDSDLRVGVDVPFFSLLNPFGLLCGCLSVAMLAMQGGFYLAIKMDLPLQTRALRAARYLSWLVIGLFLVAGYWVGTTLVGYELQTMVAQDAPSNPLMKTVITETGAWLFNYQKNPGLWAVPILGIVGALSALILSFRWHKLAFVGSSLSIVGIVATVGVSMFPFILPSSAHPDSSLMVWDASSSEYTLKTMLIAAAIFMPLIIAYTTWVYRVLRGKVTADMTENY